MTPRLYAALGAAVGVLLLLTALIVQTSRLHTAQARLTACEAQKAQLAADVRAKAAEATAADAAHKASVEAAQNTVSKETADALEKQLADARAAADRYAARVRTASGSDSRGRGPAPVPEPARAPGGADAAPDPAVLAADASNCATAYVIASGWQEWFRAQQQVAR